MERFVDRLEKLTLGGPHPPRGRVLVGMSGGVDSSVAAALLCARGLEVVGVSLHLWEEPGARPSRCCAPEDLDDARRSAHTLGIPHFTFDRQRDFTDAVVDPFVESYLAGATPSPCAACNRDVKIASLRALTARFGAFGFATGHYARAGVLVDDYGIERPALLRARDARKDQSYFLHGIDRESLARLVTPLGALTKDEVRAVARRFHLHNADKPDSEDLCFTAGDHAGFVERRAAARIRPGPIVDRDGRVIGEHRGVHRFTIGQRKGIGVALGHPVFVASIDPERATVRLGDLADVEADEAWVADVTWLRRGALAAGSRRFLARIRHRHDGTPAEVDEVSVGGHQRVRVRFDRPTRAVTPGQTCVFYDGDEVVGGGTIVAPPAREPVGARGVGSNAEGAPIAYSPRHPA